MDRSPGPDWPVAPPVSLFDQVRFSGADEPIELPSLANDLNPPLVGLLGDIPTAGKARSSTWASGLDFSGVSDVVGNAWQTKKTATLISDQFVIMAKHFHRPVGDTVQWTRPDGSIVLRKIRSIAHCPMTDITLGKLDEPVTGLAIYQVLPPGYTWETALKNVLTIHTDQEHKLLIKIIAGIQDTSLDDRVANIHYWTPPAGFEAMDERLVSGDSGHPFFVLYGGRLILLGLHWTTSAAPFASDPDLGAWIKATARTM
jgi:hypothetical protein